MVAALQGSSRTLLLLSLGARAALATDVTACSGSATTECINMDTCVVNIQGANYDLKPLQQAEGNKAEGADQYNYHFNFCSAITTLPGASCSGATGSCVGGCSVFQISKDGGNCYAAGDVGSISAGFLDPSSNVVGEPSSGITISFDSPNSGAGRSFVVRMLCGGSGDPGRGVELGAGGTGKYQVFWNTPEACPDAVSVGSWFLVAFSMSTVLYLGGGFFMLKRQGKEGTEQIPHFEFWTMALPDLVKDGVYFTVEKARGLRTGKAGYDEIKHKGQGDEL